MKVGRLGMPQRGLQHFQSPPPAVAGDVKAMDGTGAIVRCFIAFDIVFLNGNALAAEPLRWVL